MQTRSGHAARAQLQGISIPNADMAGFDFKPVMPLQMSLIMQPYLCKAQPLQLSQA